MAVTGEPPAAVATVPAVERVFAPDPALTAAYAPRLARFRALYRALKPEFARAVA
jgi:xylulokinase